jgi:hypothetical protein
MRTVITVAGLLVALALVAILSRQQLAAVAPATAGGGVAASAPGQRIRATQQVEQEVGQALKQGAARNEAADQ